MTKRPTTRQLLAKIPNVPCLYRHRIKGTNYGIKKIKGKEKDYSLNTADRKVAERKLKEWINGLEKLNAKAQITTLEQMLNKILKRHRWNAHIG